MWFLDWVAFAGAHRAAAAAQPQSLLAPSTTSAGTLNEKVWEGLGRPMGVRCRAAVLLQLEPPARAAPVRPWLGAWLRAVHAASPHRPQPAPPVLPGHAPHAGLPPGPLCACLQVQPILAKSWGGRVVWLVFGFVIMILVTLYVRQPLFSLSALLACQLLEPRRLCTAQP